MRAAAATAAAFSISCFAARSAALRFVRGAMAGLEMLLGRGLGRAAGGPLLVVAGSAEPLRVVRVGLPLGGRIEGRGAVGRTETLEGRGRAAAGRDAGVDTDAADAGRDGGLVCCSELVELLRERPGSFGADGARTVHGN